MGGIDSTPPEPEGPQSEAEEAAWEIATAESLRARGDLAQAASWYRRAANHLMEAGEDERAISVAKLAAELAALDDATNPRVSAPAPARPSPPPPPPAPVKPEPPARPQPPAPPSAAPARPTAQPAPPAPAKPAPASATPPAKPPARPVAPAAPAASAAPPKPLAAPAGPPRPAGPPLGTQPLGGTSTAPRPVSVPVLGGAPTAPRPLGAPRPASPSAPPRAGASVPAPVVAAPAAPVSVPSPGSLSAAPPRKPSVSAMPPVAPPVPSPAAPASPPKVSVAAPVPVPAPRAAPPAPRSAADPDTQLDLQAPPPSATPDDTGSMDLGALVDEAISNLDNPVGSTPGTEDDELPPQRRDECARVASRLPALPLFADLPAERLQKVARHVGFAHFDPGSMLCEAGEPEGPMFVLLEGSAWVGVAGSETPAGLVSAGDFVGELTALYGGARCASILARDPVEALCLPPSVVRALAREFPALREAIADLARERLRESLRWLAPLLRSLLEVQRRELMKKFVVEEFPPGALLLVEGEPVTHLCILAAGEAELYGGPQRFARTVRVRPGDAVGVGAIVGSTAAPVSVCTTRSALVGRVELAHAAAVLGGAADSARLRDRIGEPGSGLLV